MNQKVISIIEKVVGDEGKRQGHKGDYGFRCPFCNHTKKKLWVNVDPNSNKFSNWRCWVCDESGKSLFTLLKKTDAPKPLFKRLGNLLDKPGHKYAESKDDEKEKSYSISLPDTFKPLWKEQNGIIAKHARNRLNDRGLSYGDISKHRIGYCSGGKYKKRLIIPSYDDSGQLNYFVGRRIWSSQFPKYKNPSAPRNQIIPFESLINWREPVTIVEGPFDAIACRRNAVPLLGNSLQESLKCRLMEAPTETVNVALDADMEDVALEIGEEFLNEGFEVRLLDLPEDSDPGDLGFSEMQRLIRETGPLTFESIMSRKLEFT